MNWARPGSRELPFRHSPRRAAHRRRGIPAIAYCQGTPLRNEIEARDASLLDFVTDRAATAIASDHGNGPVAGKIQGHVVVAVA